jgi:hypothetical protein
LNGVALIAVLLVQTSDRNLLDALQKKEELGSRCSDLERDVATAKADADSAKCSLEDLILASKVVTAKLEQAEVELKVRPNSLSYPLCHTQSCCCCTFATASAFAAKSGVKGKGWNRWNRFRIQIAPCCEGMPILCDYFYRSEVPQKQTKPSK